MIQTKTMLPFKRLDADTRRRYQAYALCKMLCEFAPFVTDMPKSKLSIALSRALEEYADNSAAPSLFQKCIGRDLPWAFGVTEKPVSPMKFFFRDKLMQEAVWTRLGTLMIEGAETHQNILLLFKMKLMGMWVAHNMSPPSDNIYLALPTKAVGRTNIIIEPLKQWAERNEKDV